MVLAVQLVKKEVQALLENLVLPDVTDLQVLLGRLDNKVYLVCPVILAILVNKEELVKKGEREPKVTMALLEQWVNKACPVPLAQLEMTVLLDPVGHKDQWAKRESKDNVDTEVNKVDLVCKVFQAPQVIREKKVMLEVSVSQDKRDLKVKKDPRDQKVLPVYLDHLVNQEKLVQRVNPVSGDNLVQQEALELEELKVTSVHVVKTVQLALKVILAQLVSLVMMVQKVMSDPLECQVILDPQVNPVVLVLMELRENLVMMVVLVTGVILDPREKPDRKDRLVVVDLLDHQV